jgi:palmitoyltransferase ZDHHC9/14/18
MEKESKLRFKITSDFPVFLVGILLIIGINAAYFWFMSPKYWAEGVYGRVWTAIGLVLMSCSLVCLIATNTLNPGFIPINSAAEPRNDIEQSQNSIQNTIIDIPCEGVADSAEESLSAANSVYPFITKTTQQPRNPFIREITISNQILHEKYCVTCKCWRPVRASHCGQCERCVEVHDHHCPWTGNCIGKNNYKWFFWFLLSVTLNCLYVCGSSIYFFMNEIQPEYGLSLVPVAIALFTGFLMLSLGSMVGYHCWLTARNITTHEQVFFQLNLDYWSL